LQEFRWNFRKSAVSSSVQKKKLNFFEKTLAIFRKVWYDRKAFEIRLSVPDGR